MMCVCDVAPGLNGLLQRAGGQQVKEATEQCGTGSLLWVVINCQRLKVAELPCGLAMDRNCCR